MADTNPIAEFDFEPAFVRRALCYLDRNIEQSEFVELQQELRNDPLKRTTLVELCISQAELFEEFRQEAEDAPDMKTGGFPNTGLRVTGTLDDAPASQSDSFFTLLRRAAYGTPRDLSEERNGVDSQRPAPTVGKPWYARAGWRIAASVLLPLIVGLIIWQTQRSSDQATVALAIGAELDSKVPLPSEVLAIGPHSLEQGLMQVKLAGGATVNLEAPAKFEVLSKSRVSLTGGRLTAMVPHGSSGLTVESPDADVVDLGTEFGVDVQASIATRVEVFEGHVRAEVHSHNGPAEAQTLDANQAVMIAAGSSAIRPAEPTPLAFARSAELAERAKSTDASGYDRWKGFSDQLRSDPDLVAYYPFDNEKQDAGKLLNRSAATAGQHDGRLGFDSSPSSRPIWTTGRWPQKGALNFGVSGPTAVVIPADPNLIPTNAMTVAFWMKRSELRDPVHLIFSAAGDKMGFNVAVTGTGSDMNPSLKSLSIFFDWEGHPSAISARSVLPAEETWCFLAVTAVANGQTSIYVDGVQCLTRPTRAANRLELSDLLIGRPAPNAEADVREIFRGLMDELAIFRRVLSSEEIKRFYEAGLPR